jgi:hypothetical protein
MVANARGLTLSWRIGVAHYDSDPAFAALLEQVRANLDTLDEIAFFETVTHHLYIPLDEFAQRTALLARRVAEMKEAGVRSVGINVLTTIGHINEAWDYMPKLPFQPMVGHDGAISNGCACPSTPEFREYVRAKYTLVAEAKPDFVWVDDDIRMNNHGVAFGCFCPTCLAILAEATGIAWHREALVAALNAPERGDIRKTWVEQNSRTIESLMAGVASAIHAVDPNIATGLMTAGPGDLYCGADLQSWLAALKATKLRPGGGFYADATPIQMVGKALDVGYGARLAARTCGIADCQYELENFPYQKLKKSVTAFLDECTLSLATGCTGIAFNMLPMWTAPYSDCAAFLPGIRKMRPVWERLVAHAGALPTVGLWPAWHPKLAERRDLRAGEAWLGSFNHNTAPYTLAEIGIPLSIDGPELATVLAGREVEAFDEADLRSILSRGVLMDTSTLDILTRRGLGDLTGVRIARRIDNGAMERFTDELLNGEHAGQIRDARIEFWGDARGMADILEPVTDGVQMLATLEDYFRREQGPCLSLFENELGGRVAVLGYAQWIFLQSVAKRGQLQNIADWITRGTLPARIEEPTPVIPFVRLDDDRSRGAIVLLNAGLDPVEKLTVNVRAADVPAYRLTPDGPAEIAQETSYGGWSVELADLAPWEVAILLIGESEAVR